MVASNPSIPDSDKMSSQRLQRLQKIKETLNTGLKPLSDPASIESDSRRKATADQLKAELPHIISSEADILPAEAKSSIANLIQQILQALEFSDQKDAQSIIAQSASKINETIDGLISPVPGEKTPPEIINISKKPIMALSELREHLQSIKTSELKNELSLIIDELEKINEKLTTGHKASKKLEKLTAEEVDEIQNADWYLEADESAAKVLELLQNPDFEQALKAADNLTPGTKEVPGNILTLQKFREASNELHSKLRKIDHDQEMDLLYKYFQNIQKLYTALNGQVITANFPEAKPEELKNTEEEAAQYTVKPSPEEAPATEPSDPALEPEPANDEPELVQTEKPDLESLFKDLEASSRIVQRHLNEAASAYLSTIQASDNQDFSNAFKSHLQALDAAEEALNARWDAELAAQKIENTGKEAARLQKLVDQFKADSAKAEQFALDSENIIEEMERRELMQRRLNNPKQDTPKSEAPSPSTKNVPYSSTPKPAGPSEAPKPPVPPSENPKLPDDTSNAVDAYADGLNRRENIVELSKLRNSYLQAIRTDIKKEFDQLGLDLSNEGEAEKAIETALNQQLDAMNELALRQIKHQRSEPKNLLKRGMNWVSNKLEGMRPIFRIPLKIAVTTGAGFAGAMLVAPALGVSTALGAAVGAASVGAFTFKNLARKINNWRLRNGISTPTSPSTAKRFGAINEGLVRGANQKNLTDVQLQKALESGDRQNIRKLFVETYGKRSISHMDTRLRAKLKAAISKDFYAKEEQFKRLFSAMPETQKKSTLAEMLLDSVDSEMDKALKTGVEKERHRRWYRHIQEIIGAAAFAGGLSYGIGWAVDSLTGSTSTDLASETPESSSIDSAPADHVNTEPRSNADLIQPESSSTATPDNPDLINPDANILDNPPIKPDFKGDYSGARLVYSPGETLVMPDENGFFKETFNIQSGDTATVSTNGSGVNIRDAAFHDVGGLPDGKVVNLTGESTIKWVDQSGTSAKELTPMRFYEVLIDGEKRWISGSYLKK